MLAPSSPAAAAAGRALAYPPGTLLQSPESLQFAAVRASLSGAGPGLGPGGLGGLAEEGDEEEGEGEDEDGFADALEGGDGRRVGET